MNAPFKPPQVETRDAFEWAQMPEGPQPIPTWCKGAHVRWWDGYGNSPSVMLKSDTDPFSWDDMEWTFRDGVYFCKHDDGRLKQHHASDDLTWSDENDAWLSPPDRGYDGDCFRLLMADDGDRFTGDRRKVILRGPWSSSSLPGYCEASVVNVNASWRPRSVKPEDRPWWVLTAMAGLRLKSEVLLRIVARFEPTVRIANVRRRWAHGETYAEFVRADWDAPKGLTAEHLVDDLGSAS